MSEDTSRKRGRRVAFILGACGAAVLALAAVLLWRPLLVEYRVLRLKLDPERVWTIEKSELPNDSVEELALDAFLARSGGRQWFAGELWDHVVKALTSGPPDASAVGYYFDRGSGLARYLWISGDQQVELGEIGVLDGPPERSACYRLMRRATLRRVPVPFEPEWLVSVRETHEGESLASFNGGKETIYTPEDVRRVCTFERAPSAP